MADGDEVPLVQPGGIPTIFGSEFIVEPGTNAHTIICATPQRGGRVLVANGRVMVPNDRLADFALLLAAYAKRLR
jgi:hypothetical protein